MQWLTSGPPEGGVRIFWSINFTDIVGLVAFSIGLYQLYRTKSAAESTKSALTDAATTSRIYAILLLAPQFDKCEAQIEVAAMQDDSSQVLERFREWRRLCSELLAALEDRPVDTAFVADAIANSRGQVAPTKRRILTAEPGNLVKHTEKFREAASEASSKVGELAARVRSDLDGRSSKKLTTDGGQ